MGIFNRLFARPGPSSNSHLLSIEAARDIVQDYADFLKTSAPLPGCVADSSQLPHAKPVIKDALTTCLNVIRDPELKEHLKHGYLMLSAWQNDVGEKNLGLDFTQLDLDGDPLELAAMIQQQKSGVHNWESILKEEQVILTAELRKLAV